MGEKSQMIHALSDFIKRRGSMMPLMCTVDSVDLTEKTCYCIPINGDADIFGARLMAKATNGFIIIPKVGSDVRVSFIDDMNACVDMFSDIDFIHLNGTNYGELIQIDAITTKINTRLTTIKAASVAAFTAIDSAIVGLSGPPAVGMTAWNTAIATDSNLNKNDYKNTTIKHGTGLSS